MKGLFRTSLVVCSLLAAGAATAAGYDSEYVLGLLEQPRTIVSGQDTLTNSAVLAAWAAENAASEAPSAGASVSTNVASVSGYRLTRARIAGGVMQVQPDFALGDRLVAPDDLGEIDWYETYRLSSALNPTGTLVFTGTGDYGDGAIYFACGGDPVVIEWVPKAGRHVTRSYVVSDTAATRPYRLYRTDAPYDSDPVSLDGQYVRVFGSADLFTLRYGTNTTLGADGHVTTNEDAVVYGVYLTTDNKLYAVGDVKGQFLLVYYDTADFTSVREVQVVEACAPSVKVVSASVGDELRPTADGYATDGLYPEVVTSSRTTFDARGDFIYVHSGAASYSPHRNAAYALRPTMDEDDVQDHPWDATINWYAPDSMGVRWPFEQVQYSIRWGEGTRLVVSGDGSAPGQSPIFPSDWTVEAGGYQSPDGHLTDDLVWRGAGRSLLKVTGTTAAGLSDVAFIPVDAVLATDVDAPVYTQTVGVAVTPVDPSAACVTNDAGRTWLGYIHKPLSVTCYDPDAYAEPSENVVEGTPSAEDVAASGADAATDPDAVTQALRSDIFFVNVPEGDGSATLDVWWNVGCTAGDLAGTAYFPSVRERFRAVFPSEDTTEQIVLASEQGSGGTSVLWRVTADGVREEYLHGNAIIESATTPHVYAGGAGAVDGTGVGWNPNVAHAWCEAGDGGYVCWALRCDMVTHSKLRYPLVYVKGSVTVAGENGETWTEPKVWTYYVLPTNKVYPAFKGRMLVGEQLPGPHPLDLVTDPWLPEIYWKNEADPSRVVAYRDRKGVVWARRDGELEIHMYYANRDEYAYTYRPEGGAPREWKVPVPSGRAVPWNCRLVPNEVAMEEKPGAWTWTAEWPVASPMQIGRTLTKAADGLAEIWGAASAAVVWPEPKGIGFETDSAENDVAQLVDPTRNRTASLAGFVKDREDLMSSLGFSTDPGGNCVYRDGVWYFANVPATLSRRVWYDPNAALDECLVLQGRLDEKTGGISVLYMNVLNDQERQALKDLMTVEEYRGKWDAAVDSLGVEPVRPSAHRYVVSATQSGETFTEFKTTYSPVDHYALASLGGGGVRGGTNWVVWIENDAPPGEGLAVEEGDPVSMHVFPIVPEYYKGQSVTRTDENNLLSQLLDVLYTEPFAGSPQDYVFQWQQAAPKADGEMPSEDDWRDAGHSGIGVTRFTLGTEGTLADLENTYYRVRYRANLGTGAYETMGDAWSGWTAPCLAEGWIQRVIDSITPFTQRVTDLYDNPPETTVSMIRQIGGPYRGDVALNMDNLTEVGLLETYVTLLNKAESMSIAMGDDASIDLTGVNQQLMQLVERLDDFYRLLGNEAYSDAANPTIACSDPTSTFNLQPSTFNLSSTFAFDNQVPTLLDEELSLLRGRGVIEDETVGESVTAYRTAPCYNRLLWNFTRGITAGEVAYALNYDITAGQGEIDIQAETAAAAYPQGHGDAWGHYLSGLKLWYRLLRNPSFSWSVSMGEMNVDDHPINVDYFEEEKMAGTAAALGKAAERIVDLTGRKVWRDRGASVSAADAGYEDKVPSRAFGYGEWGNKGGVATFVNWMVVNSLLPAAETNESAYTDTGLLKINRSTVGELDDLANRYALIQRKVDRLNDNLNPLGLSDGAVPFGISTTAADGSESHFEQTLGLAKTALRNANALLEKADESTARLRALEAAGQAAEDSAAEEEDDFNRQLISYYGYPYEGDIGVGKTYPQGYEGPDLYHWSYVDNVAEDADGGYVVTFTASRDDLSGTPVTLSYDYSRLGLVVKPSNVTGTRRAQGSLQAAYQDYAAAVNSFNAACQVFEKIQDALADTEDTIELIMGIESFSFLLELRSGMIESKTEQSETTYALQMLKDSAEATTWLNAFVSNVSVPGNGFITGKSPGSISFRSSTEAAVPDSSTWREQYGAVKRKLDELYATCEKLHKKKTRLGILKLLYGLSMEGVSLWQEYESTLDSYCQSLNQQGLAVLSAFNAIGPAGERVLTLKAEAEAVLDARESARQKRARAAAKSRYSDMANRLWRDEALDVYAGAFDLAQKYVWLAAKAYDYETGGEITAGTGTSDFLDAIVGTRLPGELQADGSPMRWGGTGDAGLSDILARLEENWAVQKGALGINNPQDEITWFSLRTEAFRLLPGADGLNAWRNKLDTFRVANLRDNEACARLCSTASSTSTSDLHLPSDEPALVIPLATTIDFARNFFGHELAGGDHQFSSAYFATKIAEAGVELVGYNVGRDGGQVTTFAETPYVYLIPAGFDRMRAPTTGEVISFDVADQLLVVPNLLGSKALAQNWDALYANLAGGGATVRKYPPFRANGESNATTLIGRSVWNTQWILVIPAGSLRADRSKALEDLIWGNEETAGVTDIKIGFRTYSHWGK